MKQPTVSYRPEELAAAWNLIQKASTITLLTHDKPDADGVSACAALAHAFEKRGKSVQAIYTSQPEALMARQPRHVLINRHTHIPGLLIVCDTASYQRMYFPEAFKKLPLINIDHHISNTIRGTVNLINPAASSTCEELFIIMKAWDATLLDTYVAQCLLYGILYDSQVFQTNATTSQTLRLAADLMDAGANLFALKDELLTDKNPAIIKLWGKILNTVTISQKGTAAWVSITQADLMAVGAQLPYLVGLNNFLSQISGIDITAVFYEDNNGKTKISLRSKVSDVNALAQKFGGGGHKHAAGVLIDKSINQALTDITPLL